ncbi:conserved Plasmodium protein, unknown function [Plasmodium sp. gorilla clade G2]|uniref:conserved Plasmodium protein, unknown function n=1 Tax=Plasmodium sp. gorilla clade G2 TaxID=880535 RepID=UPI000D1FFD32|nr:conserved Plasmodium protein, unknown function [Plasmodium sp. gorilla clade G2]SOV19109.1 conserved Plasmodium protein, unknown function [Plasmodium sp. gorilla clade G2]
MGYSGIDIKEINVKRKNSVYFDNVDVCNILKENNTYKKKKHISINLNRKCASYNNIYYVNNDPELGTNINYYQNKDNMKSKHFLNSNKNVNNSNKINIHEGKIKNTQSYSYYEPLRYPAFKMSDKLKSETNEIKKVDTKKDVHMKDNQPKNYKINKNDVFDNNINNDSINNDNINNDNNNKCMSNRSTSNKHMNRRNMCISHNKLNKKEKNINDKAEQNENSKEDNKQCGNHILNNVKNIKKCNDITPLLYEDNKNNINIYSKNVNSTNVEHEHVQEKPARVHKKKRKKKENKLAGNKIKNNDENEEVEQSNMIEMGKINYVDDKINGNVEEKEKKKNKEKDKDKEKDKNKEKDKHKNKNINKNNRKNKNKNDVVEDNKNKHCFEKKENNINEIPKEVVYIPMEERLKSNVSSSDEENLYYEKPYEEIENYFEFIENKNLINPSDITNEVKFILHMTLLTLYKDQIKPSYSKIKKRLTCFNENLEIKYNFLNIYASLRNEYIVVRTKRNNIFVLLRETPKWFLGWVKTRCFKNSYPKKVWKKLIDYILNMNKSNMNNNLYVSMYIPFIKNFFDKRFIFYLNEKNNEKNKYFEKIFNFSFLSFDMNNEQKKERNSFNALFYIYNMYYNNFSYFSQCNDYYIKNVEKSFLLYYTNIFFNCNKNDMNINNSNIDLSKKNYLYEDKNENTTTTTTNNIDNIDNNNNNNICNYNNDTSLYIEHLSSEKKENILQIDEIIKYDTAKNLINEENNVDTTNVLDIFDNDIYEVADILKKKNFPFFKDYSLGKIAHIIQLCLYNGLLLEENQKIIPAYSSKNIISSIFYIKKKNNYLYDNYSNLNKHRYCDDNNISTYGYDYNENTSVNIMTKEYDNRMDSFLKVYENFLKNDEGLFFSKKNNNKSDVNISINKYTKELDIPAITNLEEAKLKIECLLRNSHKKCIYLLFFREKFLKKYKQNINPLIFGYNSLIEFLFYGCREVCKIYILNNNLLIVHLSYDIAKHINNNNNEKVKVKEKENQKENVIEEFYYSDYCYNKTENNNNNKFHNSSLEVCTIMKENAKKKNSFFITYSYWKYMSKKEKKKKDILDSVSFLNGKQNYIFSDDILKIKKYSFIQTNPMKQSEKNIPLYYINMKKINTGLFNIPNLVQRNNYDIEFLSTC